MNRQAEASDTKEYSTEFILPIEPDMYIHEFYSTESDTNKPYRSLRDFLYALAIGLVLFGAAAWAMYDRLIAVLLFFL